MYNAEGFFEPNDRGAYSVNNITARHNDDGSVTVPPCPSPKAGTTWSGSTGPAPRSSARRGPSPPSRGSDSAHSDRHDQPRAGRHSGTLLYSERWLIRVAALTVGSGCWASHDPLSATC
ncbi:hypothetical protein [Terrabacter lapilli]|uniref:hypothetical protein n=1 Tax=Terrabacter lapilli TaxID=436231 RepID=UPI0031D05D49